MYLKHAHSGDLLDVLEIDVLVDPFRPHVQARSHVGEELQEPEAYPKAELVFPSGEALPRCWTDGDYRAAGR